jgi:hypothetical protein
LGIITLLFGDYYCTWIVFGAYYVAWIVFGDYYCTWIVFGDYYAAFWGLLLYLDSFRGLLLPPNFFGDSYYPSISGIIPPPQISLFSEESIYFRKKHKNKKNY